MPIVRMPDGELVRFPDDMPQDEIGGYIQNWYPDAFGSPEPQAAQPNPVQSAPTPKAPQVGASSFVEPGFEDPEAAMFSGSRNEKPMQFQSDMGGSVFERTAPAKQTSPMRPEFRAKVQKEFDAATPEQRTQMLDSETAAGRVAIQRKGAYDAVQAAIEENNANSPLSRIISEPARPELASFAAPVDREKLSLEQQNKLFNDETTFTERFLNNLNASLITGKQATSGNAILGLTERAQAAELGSMTIPSGTAGLFGGESFAFSEEQGKAIAADSRKAIQANAKTLVQLAKERQSIPGRPATKALSEAQTLDQVLAAVSTDPLGVIGDLGVQSAPLIAPSLVAAMANPVLGVGATFANSMALEKGLAVPDVLQDKLGANFNEQTAAKAALDPELIQEAETRGLIRGGLIGSLDAASMGLAGKSLAPFIKNAATREAVNGLIAQPLAQMTLGAGGEALAQLATDGEIKLGEVVAEALGEAFTAPLDVASMSKDRIASAITPDSVKLARAIKGDVDSSQFARSADEAAVELLRNTNARDQNFGLIESQLQSAANAATGAAANPEEDKSTPAASVSTQAPEMPAVEQTAPVQQLPEVTAPQAQSQDNLIRASQTRTFATEREAMVAARSSGIENPEIVPAQAGRFAFKQPEAPRLIEQVLNENAELYGISPAPASQPAATAKSAAPAALAKTTASTLPVQNTSIVLDSSPVAMSLRKVVNEFGKQVGLEPDVARPEDVAFRRPDAGLEALGKALGVEVVVFDSIDDNGNVTDQKYLFNGAYKDGRVYIRGSGAENPALSIFGHEWYHSLEQRAPALAKRFSDQWQAYRSTPEWNQYKQALLGRGYSERQLESESAADMFGLLVSDPSFLQTLAKNEPSLFKSIVDSLKRLIDQVLNFGPAQQEELIPMIREYQKLFDTAVGIAQEYGIAVQQGKTGQFAQSNASQTQSSPNLPNQAQASQQDQTATLNTGADQDVPFSSSAPEPSPESDVKKAEKFEKEEGILPYTSEGQIEVPIELGDTSFSIKPAFNEKQVSDGRRNHPIFDLPLNKNGTVTLYLPTTNAVARQVATDRVLTGATPQSNRIYLTNESSGPKVMQDKGNMDQEMDGANVMIQINPDLLQLDQEYPDGRKDFFIPIAEGEAFAKKTKMTKLFTLDAPRTKALSKDTKLTDIERRIGEGLSSYLAMTPKERRVRLKEARDLLKREHNVGTLLGENGKLEKTRVGDYGLNYEGRSVASLGLGLASAQKINEKNLSTCPKSAICEGLCLGETSGQNLLYGGDGQFKSGPRLSQYLKTEAMVLHPEEFAVVMHAEIERFQRKMEREDIQTAIRLNVTSDFTPNTWKALIDAFPGVQFYDYTKLPTKSIASNHHLTYSSTGASQVVNGEVILNKEGNWNKMVQRMREGSNVAMAFTSRTDMPKYVMDEATGEKFQVWNGDNYDARFLDPRPGQPGNEFNKGMIVGLTNKDRTERPENAAKKYNGFFMDYDPARDGDTLVIRDQRRLSGDKTIPISIQNEASDSEAFSIPSRKQTQTPEFKRWFGDSKVVDANGEPLVVYHGSGADFSEFYKPSRGKNTSHLLDLGYHFGSSKVASDYAMASSFDDRYRNGLSRDAQSGNPKVYPVFLKISNPADLRGKFNGGNLGQAKDVLLNLAEKAGMNSRSKYVQLVDVNPVDLATVLQQKLGRAVVRNAFKSSGFDGINYNMADSGDSYVVFEPNQIKSAIGNNGQFDPENDDIRFSIPNRKQTETPAFKAFFDGSVVVDDAGQPMVQYHSTYSDFSEFQVDFGRDSWKKFGAHFGSLEAATNRIAIKAGEDERNMERSGNAAPNIMPVYLAIRNPLRLPENRTGRWGVDDIMRAIMEGADAGTVDVPSNLVEDYYADELQINGEMWADAQPEEQAGMLRDFLSRTLGVDGIVYANEFEGGGDSYIVWNKNQIKSAIGNNGKFDDFEDDIRFSTPQRKIGPNGMYSKLLDVVQNVPAKLREQPAPQWKAWLMSNAAKMGVKKDEMEWSGVMDYLDLAGKEKVTSEGIAQYLEENGVQVEEVTLGEDPQEKLGLLYEKRNDAAERFFDFGRLNINGQTLYENEVAEMLLEGQLNPEDLPDELSVNAQNWLKAYRDIQNFVPATGRPAQYERYTLPGGENYREVLLKLPDLIRVEGKKTPSELKKMGFTVSLQTRGMGETWDPDTEATFTVRDKDGKVVLNRIDVPGVWTEDKVLELYSGIYAQRTAESKAKDQRFKSSHWDDPNVIAHIRMNDRTTIVGGYVVRNKQSGRKSEVFATQKEAEEMQARMPASQQTAIESAPIRQRVLFVEEVQSDWGQDGKKKGFKATPFSADPLADGRWLVKDKSGQRITDVVASSEIDAIESARIIMSREAGLPVAPFVTDTKGWLGLSLKRIMTMAVQGGYDKVAFINGQQSANRYDLSKQVDSISWAETDAGLFNIGAFKDGSLAMGKDNLTIEEVGDMLGKEIADKIKRDSETNVAGELTGVDLKVGGKGMIAFYDQIVPQEVRGLLKKFGGGQMEMVRIGQKDQPGFTVTPELRQIVEEEGLPLFSIPQRKQTQTPEFKKWFGDSKVVDENGQPMVVYHGTDANFTEFKKTGLRDSGWHGPGYYFYPKELWAKGYGKNVMPVYLSLQNPAIRNTSDAVMAKDVSKKLREDLEAQGYDGVMAYDEDGQLADIVVFNSNQIKSAIGNNGQFDGNNPDIRFSAPQPKSQRNRLVMKDQNAADRGIFNNYSDKFLRLEQVEAFVTKKVGPIKVNGRELSPYKKQERYPGVRAELRNDFIAQEVQPLLLALKKSATSADRLMTYRYALHAEERNQSIARRNKLMPDGGSGMLTQTSKDLLNGVDSEWEVEGVGKVKVKGFAPEERAKLDALMPELDKLINGTRDLLVNAGLESQDTIDAIRGVYKHWIPLAGKEDSADDGMMRGVGSGFSVFGSTLRVALGRQTAATDILGQVVQMREQAIDRFQKNEALKEVMQYFYELQSQGVDLVGSDNTLLVQINPKDTVRYFRKGTVEDFRVDAAQALGKANQAVTPAEIEQYVNDRMFGGKASQQRVQSFIQFQAGTVNTRDFPAKMADNVSAMRVNGKDVLIRFNDPILAKAFRNMDAQQLGFVMTNIMRPATGYFRNIYTAYNPFFWATNLLRDVGATTFGSIQDGYTMPARVLANMPAAFGHAAKGLYGQGSQVWDDFRLSGSRTGFVTSYRNARDRQTELLAEFGPSNPLKQGAALGKKLLNYFLTINSVFEDGVRLALFMSERQIGKSVDEAADAVRRISVNFNRKGFDSDRASSMYVFFNAAAQGSRTMKRALQTKEGMVGAAALVSLSTAMNMITALALGEDDDGEPLWNSEAVRNDRQNNILIPTFDPERPYILIPLQYGLNAIWNMGAVVPSLYMAAESDKKQQAVKEAIQVGKGFADGFLPPPVGGLFKQGPGAVVPTIAQPIAQPLLNTNGFGRPIVPGTDDQPRNERMFKSTRDSVYDNFVSTVNESLGGTPNDPVFEVSPEDVKNFMSVMFGSFNSTVLQMTAENKRGRETDALDNPFLRKFVANPDRLEQDDIGKFYERQRELDAAAKDVKVFRERGELDKAQEIAKQPEMQLRKKAGKIRERLGKLRDRRIELMRNKTLADEDRQAQLRELDLIEQQLVDGFNRQYNSITGLIEGE